MRSYVLFLAILFSSRLALSDPYESACTKLDKIGPWPEYNRLLMESAISLPAGGGYGSGDKSIDALGTAVRVQDGVFEVNAPLAGATFCSGATYLAFLQTISRLQKNKSLHLTAAASEEMRVLSKALQPDGVGVWGRWNANGPGAAVLFKELALGRNFPEIAHAWPGDFMKIFWNDRIGKDEKGHHVLFDSVRDCRVPAKDGVENLRHVCFWSSNTANDLAAPGDGKATPGWSVKCVPQTRIGRAIFSRLEHPEKLNAVPEKMGKSSAAYVHKALSALEKSSMAPEEMYRLVY